MTYQVNRLTQGFDFADQVFYRHPSISEFYRRYPLETQAGWWRGAGIPHPRHRVMSLGGGIVIWGVKQ